MDESGSGDDDEDDSGSATVGAATIGVGGISLGTGMKVDYTLSVKPADNETEVQQLLKELGILPETSFMSGLSWPNWREPLLNSNHISFANSGKMTVSSQNSKLQAALTVIKAAQGRAANREYQPALEKYELALGALIPLLQNEVINLTTELPLGSCDSIHWPLL